MLAPYEEQKEMPMSIIMMLTQMITHLIPIPLNEKESLDCNAYTFMKTETNTTYIEIY